MIEGFVLDGSPVVKLVAVFVLLCSYFFLSEILFTDNNNSQDSKQREDYNLCSSLQLVPTQ